jgi:pyruvate/2-oxoglutarate dehydrogenase complex dihydrolipoamide acyltransferase (E2) component
LVTRPRELATWSRSERIALIFAPDEARSVGQAPALASPPRAGFAAAVVAAATVKASPLAREIAREHGVDLAQVAAAGGKIEKADVLAHIASQKESATVDGTGARLTAASPKARRLAAERGLDLSPRPARRRRSRG